MPTRPLRHPLIALSVGLSLLAGCQAASPLKPSARVIAPETRALLTAIGGVASAGATFEQAASSPASASSTAYRVAATSAEPPVQLETLTSYVTGPYPAPSWLPDGYAIRPAGEWLTSNPLVKGATTETFWTPGGTTQAISAQTTQTLVKGALATDQYTAPWVAVSDLPAFFKGKLTLPSGYTVHQAEETWRAYTNGGIKGTATGYRWQVLSGTISIAWARSLQVTQADGSKVDHWEWSNAYQPIKGKNQATQSAYGNYWESSETGNEATRSVDPASGVASSSGTWQDLQASQTPVRIDDTHAPDGTISRKLTSQMTDGRTLVLQENYATDNTGSGTVSVDGQQVGTLVWDNLLQGTVTIDGVSEPYAASRLSSKERPPIVNLSTPTPEPTPTQEPTPAPTQMPSAEPSLTPAPLTGTVALIAGSGSAGAVNATGGQASFNAPSDVARDAQGNLYVADAKNGQIRKITPAGVTTTFAGRLKSPRGLVVDRDGNLYVSDASAHRIYKFSPSGGEPDVLAGKNGKHNDGYRDDKKGSNARFNTPCGLALDAAGRFLYVADSGNHRIRKIDLAPGAHPVTTVAGTGLPLHFDGLALIASFDRPEGVAIDMTGILYVADTGNHAIRKIAPEGGHLAVTTLAGNVFWGSSQAARFNHPTDLVVDAGGALYVADRDNHAIRKLQGSSVSTLAGSEAGYQDGPLAQAKFNQPNGLALDGNGLVVSEIGSHRIRRLTF